MMCTGVSDDVSPMQICNISALLPLNLCYCYYSYSWGNKDRQTVKARETDNKDKKTANLIPHTTALWVYSAVFTIYNRLSLGSREKGRVHFTTEHTSSMCV